MPARTDAPEARAASVRIERFVVPAPRPLPTPPLRWKRLDRSMLRAMQRLPDRLRIVVLAPKQSDGKPSEAPAILRVEISPPHIRAREVLHIRVLTTLDTNGVYLRFAVWEIAVAPIGDGTFDRSDPDFPGKRYEVFARDYTMPPIPPIFTGRTYDVEVIAVGRASLASATYVPLALE